MTVVAHNLQSRPRWLKLAAATAAGLVGSTVVAHVVLPWYIRIGATEDERQAPLPGDQIVRDPDTGYTLAVTVRATPADIWPWLVQMGQGRGGFYTYGWVENALGANIHNVDRMIPELQGLSKGDKIQLTPDPYLRHPGQFMTVADIEPEHALVFTQTLPNGSIASWAFALRPQSDGTTRLMTRRRGGCPTLFDRVMAPGYVFMDKGMLRGIRERVEATAQRGH